MPRWDFNGGGVRGHVEVGDDPHPAPLSLPGRWFTVWVTCDRSFSRDEENGVVEGVWNHLREVPANEFWPPKVTATNPTSRRGGWGLCPWDVLQVYVGNDYMAWWAGEPAGIAPVSWAGRKARGISTVPVYVGLTDEERRVSGVELAILRACHEVYHCVAGDHDHTTDPRNMMYRGVALGARFSREQLETLGRVRP